jgi:glycosyltransferase involved in cell wall biosynthesis
MSPIARGGYQYTEEFLADLWREEMPRLPDSVVVNTFQMYPRSLVEDHRTKKWFFIDQTLTQLMYDTPGHMSPATRREVFVRERAGYLAAEGVIAHSRWAADSLRRDYGVPPARLHVAVPGANILASEYQAWEMRHVPNFDVPDVVRILFLGRDWRRKGLDRLLLGFNLARTRGLRAEVTVGGVDPRAVPGSLSSIAGVSWIGLLSKQVNYAGFLDTVSSFHLGATLSYWEPGGIAAREFHALGVPTLVTDACGAAEHQISDAGSCCRFTPPRPMWRRRCWRCRTGWVNSGRRPGSAGARPSAKRPSRPSSRFGRASDQSPLLAVGVQHDVLRFASPAVTPKHLVPGCLDLISESRVLE